MKRHIDIVINKIVIAAIFTALGLFSAICPAQGQPVTIPEFQAAKVFGSAGQVGGTAAADFNSDGISDVVLSDVNSNRLLLFTGTGDGGFILPPTIVPNIVSPGGIAVSDFNNDGKNDLVVAADDVMGNGDGITVLLGTGDGAFGSRFSYVTGNITVEVVSPDFNGDGKPDVAVSDSNDHTITVMFGNGDGTLSLSATYQQVNAMLLAADFNNDNRPEILCTRSVQFPLSVLPNNGNGTFGTPVSVNTNPISSPQAVAVGNFNGDANLDLVVLDTFFNSNNILPLFGNGNNTFTAGTVISHNATLSGVRVGDFNRDQKSDLAINSNGRMLIFNGNGNGTFAAPKTYSAGGGRILTADFNRDGWLDILSLTFTQSSAPGVGNFAVLLNRRNGIFNAAPAIPMGYAVRDMASADLNSDQRKDLIIVSSFSVGAGQVMYATQNSSGGFNQPSVQPLTISTSAIVTGDFTGDGKPDVVAGGSAESGVNNVALLAGNGSGLGAPSYFQVGTGVFDIAAADFNADGKLDLAFAAASANVFVALGNGNGTFGTPISYLTTNSALFDIAAGDFNSDGKADLAVAKTQTHEVATLINNGSGGFTFGAAYPVGEFPNGIRLTDLNNDQKSDLIVGTGNGIYVLLAGAGGAFMTPVQYQIPSITVGDVATGDFNGDQKIDVVAVASGVAAVVLVNDGTGVLTGQRTWATVKSPLSVVAEDFNNDQKLDFAVGGIEPGDISILLNGATQFAKSLYDYDGDGKTDLSVFRPTEGSWFINNSSNNSLRSVQFGANGDLIAPADFDGDGRTDISVFRPSDGGWYRLNSSNDTFSALQFGTNGDLPVPGDFDGDLKADITVYRPSAGSWFRINSSNQQFVAAQFGVAEDKPLVGDFDGDGKSDLAVFRPSNGTWYRINSATDTFSPNQFGATGDKPVAADYDGDGKTDLAVYRPSVGDWYIINSSNSSFTGLHFGVTEDLPAPADFDGDGKADLVVFRPSTGTWYLLRTTAGFTGFQFGANGDIPTPNAFVR